MDIAKITNLYEIKWPLYITSHLKDYEILDISIEDNVKYLLSENSRKTAYDMILPEYSTYLGRMLYMKKQKIKPLEYHYSFVDLPHFIYGKPDTLPEHSIYVDDSGKIRCKGQSIFGRSISARIIKRIGELVWIKNYSPPIRIPTRADLLEVLETKNPLVMFIEYKHTLFFKNITGTQKDFIQTRIL